MRRITGASLNGSRPAQISTSAWRGENAWRSIPKRAKSKRLAAVAMNSMAQQAVPNGIGHSELARAQLTSSSNRVTSQFGLPEISFDTRFTLRTSSSRDVEHRRQAKSSSEDVANASARRTRLTSLLDAFARRLLSLVPLQGSALPHVDVSHPENREEHQHFHQQEAHAQRAARPAEVDRAPGNQKHRLDVEHDEQHRHEVELDRKALVGRAERRHAALVGGVFQGGRPLGPDQVRQSDHARRVGDDEQEQQQEREIGPQHGVREKFHVVGRKLSRGCGAVNRTSGVSVDGAITFAAMSIKSDRWIRRMAQAHQMIEPFEEAQVRAGVVSYGLSSYGYDMRVAPEFRIFTNALSAIVDPKRFDPKSFVEFAGDVCIVPPNSFALASSVEYFRIPRNCLTICVGKSTYARCGIIVNVTPFEPEWEGFVTLEISNTTPLPARIYANEGIAQVLFFTADEGDECEVSYKDKKGKYQAQKGITLPRL